MFVAGSLWLGDTCGAVLEQLLASTVILASRAFEPVLFAHHATFLLLQMSYVHQTMEHSGNVVGIVLLLLARHLLFAFLRVQQPLQLARPFVLLLRGVVCAIFAFNMLFFLSGILLSFPWRFAMIVLGVPSAIDAVCAIWEGPIWPSRCYDSLDAWAAVLWSSCEAAFYTGIVPLQLARHGAHFDRMETRLVPLVVFFNTVVRTREHLSPRLTPATSLLCSHPPLLSFSPPLRRCAAASPLSSALPPSSAPPSPRRGRATSPPTHRRACRRSSTGSRSSCGSTCRCRCASSPCTSSRRGGACAGPRRILAATRSLRWRRTRRR